MDLRTERIGSAVILHLEGRLSAQSDTEWMRIALIAVTDTGVRHALLDLDCVREVDCSGIGQLLTLREIVHGARRSLALVAVERRQKRMLELSGLVHVFRVFADCDAGLTALGIDPHREVDRPPKPAAPAWAAGRAVACWSGARGWADMGWVT